MNINFSIILHLQSDNKSLLDFYTLIIFKLLMNYQISISNPKFLPTKTSKFTILRSPHIYKKSREQYQYNLFTSFFCITISNLFDYYKVCFILIFFKYQLPLGIFLKLKNIFTVV